jgi:hypothetical protein
LVWGVAILVFLVGGAVLFSWDGSRSLLSKISGRRSDANAAGTRGELAARRNRARAAIRDGRFDEAFEFYRALDTSRLQAEDLFDLASVLLKGDRIVLGWAALEAARRIDPKHLSTTRALDALESRVALAAGYERAALHEAAARFELLQSVPGGPQLGILVFGMARYATHPDQEDEFLDRLTVRDRAILRGVDTSAAAIRLVARLLMEAGRPREARELLEVLVASPGDGLAAPSAARFRQAPDREAAWLLSRVALQLEEHETADVMLALAGDFAKAAAASPEPAPFVGSKRCGECHRGIYREQQGESRHALTLSVGSGLKNVPLPARPVSDPVVPSVTHRFRRSGDDRIELESRADHRVIRAIVAYAVGSGRHGITMVARDEQGADRELRISYYPLGPTWGQTKGIGGAPHDSGELIGLGLSRSSLHHCLNCHTTWFRSVDVSRSGARGPEANDRAIGCERCHGPGLNHMKAIESGFAESAIALTAATPSSERLKSCTQCHAADGSVSPSDPEFTRAQGTTLLFSRCVTASNGQFGCTTCHDPHRVLDTTVDHYEAKCRGCHSSAARGAGKSTSALVAGKPDRATALVCSVNPTAKCISCHMPKVEDRSRHARFTDHHIRIHRGEPF